MKYLSPAIIRSIDQLKLRRPDYDVEELICDMAAAHRVPWKPLLEEYETWLTEQNQTPLMELP
jgi:hypothetical protein